MTILIITADLECWKCKTKIRKVLDCLTDEFCIEKVEFEIRKNIVVVHGKFDAEKLCCRIRCKAGKCIKDCKPKPDDHKPPPDVCCKPKPCGCCKPKPDKPDDKPSKPDKPEDRPSKPEPEKPKPPPPKPEYKLMPYPYPLPYPMACASWPWQCPPHQQCHCWTPPPPPPPPCKCKPCDGACKPQTPPCSCGGMPPWVWPPPPPWAACELAIPESGCTVM